MKKLLSLISISMALVWVVGHFWYHEGRSIHLFLIAAIVIAFIRIIGGGTIVIK